MLSMRDITVRQFLRSDHRNSLAMFVPVHWHSVGYDIAQIKLVLRSRRSFPVEGRSEMDNQHQGSMLISPRRSYDPITNSRGSPGIQVLSLVHCCASPRVNGFTPTSYPATCASLASSTAMIRPRPTVAAERILLFPHLCAVVPTCACRLPTLPCSWPAIIDLHCITFSQPCSLYRCATMPVSKLWIVRLSPLGYFRSHSSPCLYI
ncbi:hypothetical protein K432DRAFT_130867 [Lepidopterella palustris CBS 459.81]|uniref:Uncharacterized protein n=1 Tax=Lepidopterella palustris CBS 459.81 TaxID=1314670 RepID=A0A8E2JC51_9PEZI|nr:hypothetical protein K432DRAFT_130867 [Lepidopterella palustris CBS 459.81]